jgi:hypothetical protein
VIGDKTRIKGIHVIAHGIRVNQVQDQEQAKEEIYRQNPKLRGNLKSSDLYGRRSSFTLVVQRDPSILALRSQSKQYPYQ